MAPAQAPGPDGVATAAADVRLLLMIRTAGLLFAHGETTVGVRRTVTRLGAALGLPVTLLAQWGELRVQARETEFGAAVAVEPAAVDIHRVHATEAIADRVCAGTLASAAALPLLDDVARLPPVDPLRFIGMAAAGAAALGVIFGAQDWRTLLLIAVGAGLGAVLRRQVARFGESPFLPPFAASLLAGLVVSLVAWLGIPVAHHLLAACPCMVLVPGPHVLNGSIDLARGRIALGAARLGFATMVVLAISAGLFAGLAAGPARFVAGGAAPQVPAALDVVAAGVAVAAYGAFFNMPWRMLPGPVLIGMAAHALRWALLAGGAGVPAATLAACTLVGFCTAPLARHWRVPFGASSFAAVVALVPGLLLFEAAADALAVIAGPPAAAAPLLATLAANLVSASLIVLAMTVGLIGPKMLWDAWWGRGTPA
jgi:uncharacterized membrane protein YjjP (DUF1212 family)